MTKTVPRQQSIVMLLYSISLDWGRHWC